MTGDWSAVDTDRALRLMDATAEVNDLEDLPYFVTLQVTHPKAGYRGIRVLIIDSIQGDGVPANAARKYRGFYEFTRNCKAHGVAVIAIGHVNKRGQLAGPRGLEHHVDAVWRVEKAGTGRLFAVTKNRFGPEHPRGIPLVTDPVTTALHPSPHTEPATGVARTFIGGRVGEAELQAAVSLPTPGMRPQVMAPGCRGGGSSRSWGRSRACRRWGWTRST